MSMRGAGAGGSGHMRGGGGGRRRRWAVGQLGSWWAVEAAALARGGGDGHICVRGGGREGGLAWTQGRPELLVDRVWVPNCTGLFVV